MIGIAPIVLVEQDLLGLLEQRGLRRRVGGLLGLVDEGVELVVAEAVVVAAERLGVEQVVHEVVVRRVVGEPTGPADHARPVGDLGEVRLA